MRTWGRRGQGLPGPALDGWVGVERYANAGPGIGKQVKRLGNLEGWAHFGRGDWRLRGAGARGPLLRGAWTVTPMRIPADWRR